MSKPNSLFVDTNKVVGRWIDWNPYAEAPAVLSSDCPTPSVNIAPDEVPFYAQNDSEISKNNSLIDVPQE